MRIDHPQPPPPTAAQAARAEVVSLLAGIPQSANTLGNPKAPVTLMYFGDLECPFCRQFTLTVLPSIIRRWVRGGSLRIQYRSEQTATRQAAVFRFQQLAALAAGQQNKMWDFIELFYHEQGEEDSGYVTEKYLQGLAQQVPGLNLIAWSAARNDPTLAATLSGDAQAVKLVGFTGTPSFLIGRTGGEVPEVQTAYGQRSEALQLRYRNVSQASSVATCELLGLLDDVPTYAVPRDAKGQVCTSPSNTASGIRSMGCLMPQSLL